MRRLLRTVLTWLLVLALPAQGYAAQAMLFCGPAHHGTVVSVAVDDPAAHGHVEHRGRGHADADHHHPDGAVHEPAEADAADADAGPHDLGASGDNAAKAESSSAGTCSACAACCNAAAITNPSQAFAPVRLTSDYGIAAIERHDSRADGGLERPPRTLLA